MNNPKITIITPVKNSGEKLYSAIESIFSQNYNNIENIIIDSNSDDNTEGVVNSLMRKYGNKILYIRESDNSVAEAMNKGMKHASGDFIGCLNADDVFMPGAFNLLKQYFLEFPDCILHGAMNVVLDNRFTYIQSPPEDPDFTTGQVINHPSTFIPRKIYQMHGGYDPIFKIAGDWDIFIKYKIMNGVKFKKIDHVLTSYQIGGLSTTKPLLIFKEMHQIRKKYKFYHLIDFRYYRDYILYMIFNNNIIYYSYLKRNFISKIKAFIWK